MDSLLLVSVLLTAAGHPISQSCTELRNAFSGYRAAVSQGTEVGHYFSHCYLAGQVDALLVDGDEAVIPHNVKATRRQIRIAPVARSDYQLIARCSVSVGSISLTFPTGNTRSLRLGYILESGAWRIDKLEITLGSAAADGT
jgi:hypothetical protein